MDAFILYRAGAFQLHVTQKPLVEASPPKISIALRSWLKDKQGFCGELL